MSSWLSFLARLSKLHSMCPDKQFEEDCFLSEKEQVFWNSAEHRRYWALFSNFFRWAWKIFLLHFQRNLLRKRFSPKNPCFLIFFEHWAENVSLFWRNFLDVVIKTDFYVSGGSFWKILLRNRFFILFRILSENILACYRKTFNGKIKTWICVSRGLFE